MVLINVSPRPGVSLQHPLRTRRRGLSGGVLEVVLTVGAAALLYLGIEDLLVEGHEAPETPLTTAIFFLAFVVLTVIEAPAQPVSTGDKGRCAGEQLLSPRRLNLLSRAHNYTATRSAVAYMMTMPATRPPKVARERMGMPSSALWRAISRPTS